MSQAASGAPATLVLDFETAFPSLGLGWIHNVLECVPLPLRRVVAALHAGIGATMLFRGSVVGRLALDLGINQGCPLSGSLFVSSLDPLVRRTVQPCFVGSCLCAFADDLAVVLGCIVASLAFVLAVLGEWGRATGLRLKPPKGVAIPGLARLERLQGGVRVCSRRGRHPGGGLRRVSWGVGAMESSALEAPRTRGGRPPRSGTHAARMALFGMRCMSPALHNARFARLERDIIFAHKCAVQRLTQGLSGWHCRMSRCIPQSLGFPWCVLAIWSCCHGPSWRARRFIVPWSKSWPDASRRSP